jgi:restriction endonuclease Mrr
MVGFAVIFFLARYAPNVPRTATLAPGEAMDTRPEITGDEFKDLIDGLVEELGLVTVFSSMGTGGVVEMTLRESNPLSGGRLLLYASPVLQGQIEAAELLGFAEGVRGDMGALKGIFIALAGFTDEAKACVAASPAPVDVIDSTRLCQLIQDHLEPERAQVVLGYRGFRRRV